MQKARRPLMDDGLFLLRMRQEPLYQRILSAGML
jgi:hypothetical protein